MQPTFVFDAHVDSIQRSLDLGHDLTVAGPGHLDLERGKRGGLGAVVLAAWCEPRFIREAGAYQRTVALVGEARRLATSNPGQARLVLGAADLEAARAAGEIGLILGIEGGHSIECEMAKLEEFYERGVRLMTLVWNNHLPWIRSCQAVPDDLDFEVPAGLSDFGRGVVERMNTLGMLIDVSHAGDRSVAEVLQASNQPVIASHSGCRAINNHPRNLTDSQLRSIADSGGVVGIVFHGGFLDASARKEDLRIYADPDYRAIQAAHPTGKWVKQSEFHQAQAAPMSIDVVANHLVHAINIAGAEHVGLGSDFDGIPRCPDGLLSCEDYPRLEAALHSRGLQASVIERVMGLNMARLFTEVVQSGFVTTS